MSKKITKEEAKRISKMIRIFIGDDEIEKYRSQLETSLTPVEVFEELDTSDTEITSHSVGTKNVFREDEAHDSLSQDAALQNAKYKKDGYIVVKRVIDGD